MSHRFSDSSRPARTPSTRKLLHHSRPTFFSFPPFFFLHQIVKTIFSQAFELNFPWRRTISAALTVHAEVDTSLFSKETNFSLLYRIRIYSLKSKRRANKRTKVFRDYHETFVHEFYTAFYIRIFENCCKELVGNKCLVEVGHSRLSVMRSLFTSTTELLESTFTMRQSKQKIKFHDNNIFFLL